MSTRLRLILGMALACLLALGPHPGAGDEATQAVMARHPLYPIVAGILYLQTGKDIDSLSKQEVADAVGAIVTGYPELELPVVAAIVHGAMTLRADASTEILDAAVTAQMALSESEETMPMSPMQGSGEEELEAPGGSKRTGTIVEAVVRTAAAKIAEVKAARAQSTKGFEPSKRSQVYEQVYEKLMARYDGWASAAGTLSQAIAQAAAAGVDLAAASERAQATTAEALAQLAATTQQSPASVAHQMSTFFAELKAMVGSVMQSQLELYSLKVREPYSHAAYAGFLRAFLELRQEASPQ